MTKKSSNNTSFFSGWTIWMLVWSTMTLACVGVLFSAFMIPSESHSGPGTNSNIQVSQDFAANISKRIHGWIPGHDLDDHKSHLPDWSNEFWTPIDIDINSSSEPMVVLCKLNFKQYYEQPHFSPMFRDLEAKSNCYSSNRRRERLSVLLDEIKLAEGTLRGRVVKPSGFIFHESRVGSTLIANLLASDPFALVFSESTPIANAILHCTSCNHEKQVQLFRDVLTLMGRSPIHNRMFVKFQSITTTKINIALEAFPDTPWAFVFRRPVQTMMSHLDPAKGMSSAPCLRSKRAPPQQVRNVIDSVEGAKISNDAWCAAHLNMLCEFALEAFSKFNATAEGSQRALFLNYDSLPGVVPRVLLPFFGVVPLEFQISKMEEEAKHYSKSRNSAFRLFFGDSADKEKRATKSIKQFADTILMQSFNKLNHFAVQAILNLGVSSTVQQALENANPNWSILKDIRGSKVLAANTIEQIEQIPIEHSFKSHHSSVLDPMEHLPWSPFANTHTSKPFDSVQCPFHPDPTYPKAYPIMNLLTHWNTDSTEIPPFHYDSICHFDYTNRTQRQQAYNYRDKEVPFIVYNIPEVDEVVKKWNDINYMSKLLGNKMYRTEASEDNHFMYWRGGGMNLRKNRGWKAPTSITTMKFQQWLQLAIEGQNKTLAERTHRYFRVSSDMENDWLSNELPFFKPKKNLFLVNPNEQHGIHCRFGMRSVIAEAHFDGSRNAVVEIGGLRRWILAHPDQCKSMHMLPESHPSGRHSAVDWSKPDLKAYPNFSKVVGNEVILQPGDFLFVPTFWIHYIVSLNINFQCNSRSGIHQPYAKYIQECGF
jgi:hypothetical protein